MIADLKDSDMREQDHIDIEFLHRYRIDFLWGLGMNISRIFRIVMLMIDQLVILLSIYEMN